ncbi:MAG TPA: glycosyltransferase [Terriglobales bacterium]|nr:glycosyltransferase [Terriglobales bacterium]
MPFASVLIDTYNHEPFIEKAVVSVLEQDFPASDREILVVDDGSTDRTPEILRKFQPYIRLIKKSNGGQASAFNAGIPECRGEFIAFLDGDDWWVQGKLRRVAEIMAADSSLGMIGHAIIESFNDGYERVIAPSAEKRFRLDSLPSAECFRSNRCYFGTSRLALRASVAKRILPIPESIVIEADEYLFTLGAALAESLLLTDPLTHYRIHGANLFMASSALPGGEIRKARSLAALVDALRTALPAAGVPPAAAASVLELVSAEATQLRLQIEGGFSWETYRTERTLYRIQHPVAPWKSSAFRALSMIPALLLPPRWFYSGRRWLGSRSWYKRARRDLLPVPQLVNPGAPASIRKSQES